MIPLKIVTVVWFTYNIMTSCIFACIRTDRYGYHITKASYFICHDQNTIKKLFENLRNYDGKNNYPKTCGKFEISGIRDLTTGYDDSQPNKKAVSTVCGKGSCLSSSILWKISPLLSLPVLYWSCCEVSREVPNPRLAIRVSTVFTKANVIIEYIKWSVAQKCSICGAGKIVQGLRCYACHPIRPPPPLQHEFRA